MIKNRVHILMERSTNPNITGYEVLASSLMVFGVVGVQKTIAVIPNPKGINPIKVRMNLNGAIVPRSDIYSRIYTLKHKSIILNQDHYVKVIINGTEIERGLYVLNEYSSQLLIYIVINDEDIVEAEYYIDGIEYEFISENEERYVVRPMIDSSNAFISRHNILI